MNPLIITQKTKQVGVNPFSDLSRVCAHFVNQITLFFVHVHSFCLFFFPSEHVTDEQLFSIMESICALVDSVPEHELIALSCGNELLVKRAQRCVHMSGKQLCYHTYCLCIPRYD